MSGKSYSASDLIQQGDAAVDRFEFNLALKFYRRALELEPTNATLLDTIGDILAEKGDHDEAKAMFTRSIELAPTASFGKYMSLAQLLEGAAALQMYLRGIDLLRAQKSRIETGQEAGDLITLNKTLATAYCACGELFMTDLCMEANAESECERLLGEALACNVGGSNPEPFQAMANFRLSQNRPTDAVEFLTQVVAILDALGEDDDRPSMAFRNVTAKLLIECGKHDQAVGVLESMLEEDDEQAETHYLLGTCLRAGEDQDLAAALESFNRCKQLLTKANAQSPDSVDPSVLADVETQIAETTAALEAAPAQDGNEDDGEGEGDEDDDNMET